jgi:hypothetical protein
MEVEMKFSDKLKEASAALNATAEVLKALKKVLKRVRGVLMVVFLIIAIIPNSVELPRWTLHDGVVSFDFPAGSGKIKQYRS